MLYDNIIFYNNYHNGDLHGSRTFVKYITEYFYKNDVKCSYYHNNKYSLIKDINNLNIKIGNTNISSVPSAFVSNKNLYINTWYGSDNIKYIHKYNCSFNCYYHLFDDILRKYSSISLSDFSNNKEDFFPDIDFSKYNISNIDKWINNNKGYKAFLCNCDTKSGQSDNFSFNPIISILSDKYPDITWIITDNVGDKINKPNVIYSDDIIGNNGDDLNENGYLSCFCDLIVGRNSGAFSFVYNKYNFLKSNKTIISFLNKDCEIMPKWYDDKDFSLNYSCNVIDSRENEMNNIVNLISKYIS